MPEQKRKEVYLSDYRHNNSSDLTGNSGERCRVTLAGAFNKANSGSNFRNKAVAEK